MSEYIYDVSETQIIAIEVTNIISIISTFILLLYAFKTNSLSSTNNILILCRSLFDMIFSISSLCSAFIPNILSNGCINEGRWISFASEISLIGSELSFLCFSFNLVLVLRNPFLNLKRLIKKQIPCILIISVIVGICLYITQSNQALSPLGICWIETQNTFYSDNMLWFFYIPFSFIYVLNFICHFYSLYMHNGSNNKYMNLVTLHLHRTLVYICVYTFYWVITMSLLMISYMQLQNITETETYNSILFIYAITLSVLISLRGFLNMTVYIVNSYFFKMDDSMLNVYSKDLSQYLREELLLYIAKGIETCLNCLSQSVYLSYTDYDYKELNRIHMKKEENNKSISFTDYAPKIFAYIRSFYNINANEYKNAITHYIQENMQESGAFIYYSQDHKYVVKTIKKSDANKFLSILPLYLNYLTQNKYTYITKIYGLYSIKLYSEEIYLIVMNNFLCFKTKNGYALVPEKYDLKGSYVDRTALLSENVHKCIYCNQYYKITDPSVCESSPLQYHVPDITYKDQDLSLYVEIEDMDVYYIYTQIMEDTTFLMYNNIMDYSLLLGVYAYTNKTRFLSKLNNTYKTSSIYYNLSEGKRNKTSDKHVSVDTKSESTMQIIQTSIHKLFHSKQKTAKKKYNDIYTSLLSEEDNSTSFNYSLGLHTKDKNKNKQAILNTGIELNTFSPSLYTDFVPMTHLSDTSTYMSHAMPILSNSSPLTTTINNDDINTNINDNMINTDIYNNTINKNDKNQIPAEDKHIYCENENSYLSKSRDCRYFLGIIDIFQEYNITKQSEFFAKTVLLRKDKDGISSINPIEYKERFMENVIKKIFPISENMSSLHFPSVFPSDSISSASSSFNYYSNSTMVSTNISSIRTSTNSTFTNKQSTTSINNNDVPSQIIRTMNPSDSLKRTVHSSSTNTSCDSCLIDIDSEEDSSNQDTILKDPKLSNIHCVSSESLVHIRQNNADASYNHSNYYTPS